MLYDYSCLVTWKVEERWGFQSVDKTKKKKKIYTIHIILSFMLNVLYSPMSKIVFSLFYILCMLIGV